MEDSVIDMVRYVAKQRFGDDAVGRCRRDHEHPALSLKYAVDVSEGNWITPTASDVSCSFEDIRNYPSGSTIVFRRTEAQAGRDPEVYHHYAVLLRIARVEYVVEVQRRRGEGPSSPRRGARTCEAKYSSTTEIWPRLI